MRMKRVFIVFLAFLISGCAHTYRTIKMSDIPFNEFRNDNNISYSIRQGVMFNLKNKFFFKREVKRDIDLIAFKIVNKTDQTISISDMDFFCGATLPLQRISVDEYYNSIKQKSNLYWLYSVGMVVYPKPAVYKLSNNTSANKPDNPKKFIKNGKQFIPLPFGLPMAAVNYGISKKANNKLQLNLQLLDLSNKVIQPHDSISGILTFKNVGNCGDIFISIKN